MLRLFVKAYLSIPPLSQPLEVIIPMTPLPRAFGTESACDNPDIPRVDSALAW